MIAPPSKSCTEEDFFMEEKTRTGMSARKLAFCAVAIALAFVTSYIRLFTLPYGGEITLFSMLFICLIGYWYGLRAGLISGLVYGILIFLQEPFVLTPLQFCFDYLFAFAGLGLSGVFHGRKNGLIKGYILGIMARGAFHAVGGYLFWMSFIPDNFPQAITFLYPIVYNYSFILIEGVITIIVLVLPPVKKAIDQITRIATQ